MPCQAGGLRRHMAGIWYDGLAFPARSMAGCCRCLEGLLALRHVRSSEGCSAGLPRASGCAQGEEAFQCAVCKERTAATKRLRLHRLPPVLMLHIKRFKANGTTREKLTANVTFPLQVRAPPERGRPR